MKREVPVGFRPLDEADAAAIWPQAGAVAPFTLGEIEARPAAAVPDVPTAVGVMLAGSYFALIGVCFATLAGSAEALFAIVVSGLYVLVYCGVPWIFLRIEGGRDRRPSLAEFMRDGLDTATGRSTGGAALVQMLVVPVMLFFCLLTIGLTVRVLLPS